MYASTSGLFEDSSTSFSGGIQMASLLLIGWMMETSLPLRSPQVECGQPEEELKVCPQDLVSLDKLEE